MHEYVNSVTGSPLHAPTPSLSCYLRPNIRPKRPGLATALTPISSSIALWLSAKYAPSESASFEVLEHLLPVLGVERAVLEDLLLPL